MNNSIKQHLSRVTVQNLVDFRNEAFTSYASSTNEKGLIELGVNGNGDFAVRIDKKIIFSSLSANAAIKHYTELLNQ